MKHVPEVNSQFTEQFIRQFDNVDISVAVATPSGLITPIVKSADLKGLSTISNDIKSINPWLVFKTDRRIRILETKSGDRIEIEESLY